MNDIRKAIDLIEQVEISEARTKALTTAAMAALAVVVLSQNPKLADQIIQKTFTDEKGAPVDPAVALDQIKTAIWGTYKTTAQAVTGDWKGYDDTLRYVQKHNKVPTPRLIHPSDEDAYGRPR